MKIAVIVIAVVVLVCWSECKRRKVTMSFTGSGSDSCLVTVYDSNMNIVLRGEVTEQRKEEK